MAQEGREKAGQHQTGWFTKTWLHSFPFPFLQDALITAETQEICCNLSRWRARSGQYWGQLQSSDRGRTNCWRSPASCEDVEWHREDARHLYSECAHPQIAENNNYMERYNWSTSNIVKYTHCCSGPNSTLVLNLCKFWKLCKVSETSLASTPCDEQQSTESKLCPGNFQLLVYFFVLTLSALNKQQDKYYYRVIISVINFKN